MRPNVFHSAICTIAFTFPMFALLNSHGDVQKHYYQSILIPFVLISIGLQRSILDVSEILPAPVTQDFNVCILPFKPSKNTEIIRRPQQASPGILQMRKKKFQVSGAFLDEERHKARFCFICKARTTTK